MRKNRWLTGLTGLLIVLILLPAAPAWASDGPPDDGIVVWNRDYTLEEGETLGGDLVIFNGDATIEEGSRVEGAVIVWNGSATIEGTVEGDVVVSNGDIYLGDNALVEGQVVCSWSCNLQREEGSRVEGGVSEGVPLPTLPSLPILRFQYRDGTPIPIPALSNFWASGPSQAMHWAFRLIRGLASILVVAVVGGLIALIWPDQTAHVSRTLVSAPWPSLGVGLLTFFLAVVLIVLLTITICLAPVAALTALALGAAGLFGWVAVGALLGERLLVALKAREIAPLWAAGLGTLVITIVSAGLDTAFCLAPLGWLLTAILGWMGLGAVVLTRFGTAAYTPVVYQRAASPVRADPINETVDESGEDPDGELPGLVGERSDDLAADS
ncbi:MAG TPA: polymer-forming cytoskeletal protein [Chloroflexi bacterium]|nr:polymer-forming cytoskeletal protein [Chloroflexota bacterium]